MGNHKGTGITFLIPHVSSDGVWCMKSGVRRTFTAGTFGSAHEGDRSRTVWGANRETINGAMLMRRARCSMLIWSVFYGGCYFAYTAHIHLQTVRYVCRPPSKTRQDTCQDHVLPTLWSTGVPVT
uniref:Uncharacterized protein n=1 Tax=Anopheles farauti TaxID=69004 RepID=A0A182R0E3_9DIPT